MNPVSVIRAVSGLSQRVLALRAGTSQPTIASYESGSKSPTWRTIQQIADRNGLACYPCVSVPMTRTEQRSLHLHEAMVSSVYANPDEAVALARRNVRTMRAVNPHADHLLDRWEEILDTDVGRMVTQMVDPSELGRELRQVTPFAGLMGAGERAAVYRSFRESA